MPSADVWQSASNFLRHASISIAGYECVTSYAVALIPRKRIWQLSCYPSYRTEDVSLDWWAQVSVSLENSGWAQEGVESFVPQIPNIIHPIGGPSVLCSSF